MEKSVIGPNAGFYFLVDLNNVWPFFARLEPLSGLIEFSILGKCSASEPFRLVEDLGIRYSFTLWLVVTFINEDCTVVLHFITIRGVRAY